MYSEADVAAALAKALSELDARKSAERLNSGVGFAKAPGSDDDNDDDDEADEGHAQGGDADVAAAAVAAEDERTLADSITTALASTPKHKSTEAAVAYLNKHGMNHGYAVSIGRSSGWRLRTKTGYMELTSYIGCVCRGQFKSQASVGGGKQKRSTSTLKVDCPFRLTAKETKWKEGDQKKRMCLLKAVNLEHNHPLALQPGVFAVHRQMARKDDAAEGIISAMLDSHAKPSTVQTTLTSHVLARGEVKWAAPTGKDIANWKAKDSLIKAANGISDIDALVSVLERNNWEVISARDAFLEAVAVVAVYRPARELAIKLKCNVFQWDATFSTNKKNWMLLDWTTTTPSYETMTIGCAFYLRKTVESYVYIVSRLLDLAFLPELPALQVLPTFVLTSVNITDDEIALISAIAAKLPESKHMLDSWHVEKDILAYCRNGFTEAAWADFLADWRGVQAAPTVELMMQRFNALYTKYASIKSHGKSVTAYLKKQWMSGNELKYARCHTKLVLHLGNTTQQRVEGNHGYLKGFASGMSRNNSLPVCGEKLSAAVLQQIQRIGLSLDKVSTTIPTSFRGILYGNLVGRVHKWALTKIAEQEALYTNRDVVPLKLPCTGEFFCTLGLPCAHILGEFIDAGSSVPVARLHPFWLIGSEKGERPEPLKDAIKILSKRKMEGKKPRQGKLGRIPSAFESVEFAAQEEEKAAAKRARPNLKITKKVAAAEAALADAHAGGGLYLRGVDLESVFAPDEQHKKKKHKKAKAAITAITQLESEEEDKDMAVDEEEEEQEEEEELEYYNEYWENEF